MNIWDELAKDERFYRAVRDGIADGLWRVATRGTGVPSAEFCAVVREGVREAVEAKDLAAWAWCLER